MASPLTARDLFFSRNKMAHITGAFSEVKKELAHFHFVISNLGRLQVAGGKVLTPRDLIGRNVQANEIHGSI